MSPKATAADFAADIYQQGFVELDTPAQLTNDTLDATFSSFVEFLGLAQAFKDKCRYLLPPEQGGETGYKRPDPSKGGDAKELFHYRHLTDKHPSIVSAMKSLSSDDRKTVTEFFGHCKDILQAVTDTYREDVIKVLDAAYPGIYDRTFKDRMGGFPNYTCLRIVKYDYTPGAHVAAAPHFDRSASTIAIKSTGPGFYVGLPDKPVAYKPESGDRIITAGAGDLRRQVLMRPAEDIEGKMRFFPGFNLGSITDIQKFPPIWHEALQEGRPYDEDNAIARIAMLVFFGYTDIAHVSKDATHLK